MAGNPYLCLSRAEWARRFGAFIREATPENLLAELERINPVELMIPDDWPQGLRKNVVGPSVVRRGILSVTRR